MDRYSGKILDVGDPTIGTAGEVFTHWQWSGPSFRHDWPYTDVFVGLGLSGTVRYWRDSLAAKTTGKAY
jgi:hypothetical protein